MSRTFKGFLVIVALGTLAGVGWFLLRHRPGEYDIAASAFPVLPAPVLGANDWPWWRGPTRDNHAATVPTEWSESKNIVWKKSIPGTGHSSPISAGDNLYLTSADASSQKQVLLCLNRKSGETVWSETLHEKNFPERIHGENTHASSTAASDGINVFAAFANGTAIHLSACDLATGKRAWTRDCGPQGRGFGYGSSIAVWGPYVYVSDDSPSGGWLTAINRQTGEVGWRRGRKTGIGSYGSPTIVENKERAMLVLPGNGNVSAYDAKSGDTLWETEGLGETSGNTATTGGGMIFASSGYPTRTLLALREDGTQVWKKGPSNDFPYPPTMLFHEGCLYIVSDQALVSCYDAGTGSKKWSERLNGSHYASPLYAGGNLYACGRDGRTTIFKADPAGYEEIAINKLDGNINASPIAVDGRLFIRTGTHLYCIGK